MNEEHIAVAATAGSRRAALLGPMRLPFLLLGPVCVAVGVATAVLAGHDLDPSQVALVVIGAVAAHIAVNALNEYDDFRSGLDLRTTRTPFSGGSGTLPAQPARARYALVTGLTALAIAAAVGVFFWRLRGPGLLAVGLPGLALTAAYTPLLTRSPLLCLLAPGLGFGTFMVLGTHFALTGSYSAAAAAASLVPLLLVSNLLLINQFPDIAADRAVGRRHLIIVHGVRAGVTVFGLFLVGTYATVVTAVAAGILPIPSLLALATAPLALVTYRGASRHATSPVDLIPYLGRNVVVVLATPLLLAAGTLLAT